jgi:hypothetical protein
MKSQGYELIAKTFNTLIFGDKHVAPVRETELP